MPAKKSVRKRRNGKSQRPDDGRGQPGLQYVNAPVARSARVRKRDPRIRTTPTGVTITHREYLAPVSASAADFAVLSRAMNPGLGASFPWLSQIARQYESYTFTRLRFNYVPSCSTATAGSVQLAVDFDAADPLPTTRPHMMSYSGAISGPVWSPLVLDAVKLDLFKFAKERYTRGTIIPANLDIKTYDVGMFIVATDGVSSAVGDVYVDYTIVLRTPQVTDIDAVDSGYLHATADVTRLIPLGSGPTEYGSIRRIDNTHLAITGPGRYLLNCYATGTTATGTSPIASMVNGSYATAGGGSLISTNNAMWLYHVIVDTAEAIATFDLSSYAALAAMYLRASPYGTPPDWSDENSP